MVAGASQPGRAAGEAALAHRSRCSASPPRAGADLWQRLDGCLGRCPWPTAARLPCDPPAPLQDAPGGSKLPPGVVEVTREGVVLDPAAVEDRRTEAEKKADAHFLKYEEQRARKAAAKSHRRAAGAGPPGQPAVPRAGPTPQLPGCVVEQRQRGPSYGLESWLS